MGQRDNAFSQEIFKRTQVVPKNISGSRDCISIDLTGTTSAFSSLLEEILSCNPDKFKVLIRGEVYYVEVLNKIDS